MDFPNFFKNLAYTARDYLGGAAVKVAQLATHPGFAGSCAVVSGIIMLGFIAAAPPVGIAIAATALFTYGVVTGSISFKNNWSHKLGSYASQFFSNAENRSKQLTRSADEITTENKLNNALQSRLDNLDIVLQNGEFYRNDNHKEFARCMQEAREIETELRDFLFDVCGGNSYLYLDNINKVRDHIHNGNKDGLDTKEVYEDLISTFSQNNVYRDYGKKDYLPVSALKSQESNSLSESSFSPLDLLLEDDLEKDMTLIDEKEVKRRTAKNKRERSSSVDSSHKDIRLRLEKNKTRNSSGSLTGRNSNSRERGSSSGRFQS